MSEDHLDKETSISAKVTATGVEAKARSRAVAAFDRLVGNLFEKWNAPAEAKVAEVRAISDARIKIIEAATDLGIKQLDADPEFTKRVVVGHLEAITRRQQNKEAVVSVALEDLRMEPPTEEQASTGSENLNEDFLNRFERYAEDATGEELRAKWGKVLAAEIREPGTVSAKTMRVVDELDVSTALLFERVCQYRLKDALVKCLIGELSVTERAQLVSAGLLVDPGFTGHFRICSESYDSKGRSIWLLHLGIAMASFGRHAKIPEHRQNEVPPIQSQNTGPGMPIYLLTDVGVSVASILTNNEENTVAAYLNELSSFLDPEEVCEFRDSYDGRLVMTRIYKKS